MKISFVTQNEAPFRMRWMDELAKFADITVFHLNEYDDSVDEKYINYHTNVAVSVDATKEVLGQKVYDTKAILDTEHDLLLLDGYGFLAQQLFIEELIRKKIKYGLSVDGGFIPEKENVIKKIIKIRTIKNASFILSTSKETDVFLMYYGASKEKIYRHKFSNIYLNDVMKDNLSKDDKDRLRDSLGIKKTFTFLYCGRLIESKGLDVLSSAANRLRDGFQIIIVGGSKDLAESVYGMEFSDKFIFVPFQQKEQLKKYYQASDVFVLPTKHDAWGLVVGEAMANGLPVITTDKCLAGVAMITEGKNGYIFKVDDEDELLSCMTKIMSDDSAKMGNECLKTASKYTIEESSKEDIDTFKLIFSDLKEQSILE